MADEKRRLIYELIVEATGVDKAKQATSGMESALRGIASQAKKMIGPLAAAFTIKGIQEAIDDMTRYNQQLEALGVTGAAAATALEGVQTAALATGQSMESVGKAMLEAVNLQQILGRSTDYASRTTQAFVAIAAAEGRSAESAAQQIQTLAFALDAGTLNGKEFINMMKQSNTFQTAAKEALGKTTAELVAMAKAGDITGVQLTKVIFKLEEIGKQKQAGETIGTFTEKAATLFKVLAQGIGKGATGSGNDKAPLELVDPDAITNAEKLVHAADGIGQELGGLGRIGKNSLDLIADGFRLSFNIVTDGIDDLETARDLTQAYTRDVRELAEAWEDVKTGFVAGTDSDPRYSEAAKAKRKLEREASERYALWKAEEDQIARDVAQGKLNAQEHYRQMQKWLKEQREKEAADAEREQKRLLDERKRERDKFYDEQARENERRMDQQARDLMRELETKPMPGLEESIKQLNEASISALPEFERRVIDSFEQMEEASAVLQDAFGSLFSGGIQNAREFFQVVLQGLSNIYAQLAAKAATEGINALLDMALGAWKGPSASAKLGGSGVDVGSSAGWWHSAKGHAFQHGYALPLASGGVVGSPTTFGMGSGGMGLMGEAGPEAVMPLKRTSGGKLGVAGAMPNITLVNNLGVPAAARMQKSNERMQVVLEAAQMGANLAESRMNRSLRTGYGSTAQSIQRTYGLRRRT